MAVKRRGPAAGLLHHSEQGCTYASEDYRAVLDAHAIICSMSRRGNCHDNAVMESFFSTVKTELREHFASCDEAQVELFDYIEVFYNQRRRHSTIGYVSPAAFERQAAPRRAHRPKAPVGDEVVYGGVPQPCPTDDRRSFSETAFVVKPCAWRIAKSRAFLGFCEVAELSPRTFRTFPRELSSRPLGRS
jgi:hypothetical protein